MRHKFDLNKIIAELEDTPLVGKVELLLSDEIETRGFYKLRCVLIPSSYKLDIKFIKTEKDLIYAYQLYADEAMARWDNEPHYPDLANFPHHYHRKGKVAASALSGRPMQDIKKLFSVILEILESDK
ncbi:MAG: hypothetical protein HQL09_09785 [Nitrospirae bacterium]|nr:hypothetical protein [Nitrospirota bacterium]